MEKDKSRKRIGKKYFISDKPEDCLEYRGEKIKRIYALCSFGNVKRGDRGGYISPSAFLSNEGLCWIYDDAKLCGGARVENNASLRNEAVVTTKCYDRGEHEEVYQGPCSVSGIAVITGNSTVVSCIIADGAVVEDSDIFRSHMFNNSKIYRSAVYDSELSGNVKVSRADVYDSRLLGNISFSDFEIRDFGPKRKSISIDIEPIAEDNDLSFCY